MLEPEASFRITFGSAAQRASKRRRRLFLFRRRDKRARTPQSPTTLSGPSLATSSKVLVDLRETRTGRSMKRTAITPCVLLVSLIFLLPFGIAILNFPTRHGPVPRL
jgi:hypothetical protein